MQNRDRIVTQTLALLECQVREANTLASPGAVKDHLRLKIADLPYEVFAVVFLDIQNRVIAIEEMFRGTLTQTSAYPREVVKAALGHNAAAVVLSHNHPKQRCVTCSSCCKSGESRTSQISRLVGPLQKPSRGKTGLRPAVCASSTRHRT